MIIVQEIAIHCVYGFLFFFPEPLEGKSYTFWSFIPKHFSVYFLRLGVFSHTTVAPVTSCFFLLFNDEVIET